MNITQGVPLMLRAAKSEVHKARSQWKWAVPSMIFVAAFTAMLLTA